MTTTREFLEAIHGVLIDPDNWCTGVTSRNADGVPSFLEDPRTCKWCLYGALLIAEAELPNARQSREEAEDVLLCTAESLFDGCHYIDVNDHLGHQAVIKLLEAAIEKAPKS